ncbi:MAG: hypothetical protein HFJ44_06710 [Clostridia bacterium]|jgi:hypothetical protein|nr:hypothetical protein [Clostridia bacterium]
MKIDIKKVKITVTVPHEHTKAVRDAICNAGAGVIGNYTYCTVSHECTGTFKPTDKANPYIGEKNKIEFVKEEKIETICDIKIAKKVIQELRKAHPYEEPAINIIPLINEEDL